jgi:pyruvate dehydrogenase E1 component alpha subunit
MKPDLWSLYSDMYRSRVFEEAATRLWQDGLISGEMHLGTGEEAVVAGVMDHLQDGDALALDHRGTSPLLMVGVDPLKILLELVGHPEGLCGGRGGHMHLFSKEHLAASSGIVGASGPAAAGFALASKYLRPGKIGVAFFGEGALNQGMLMESMNLAVVWKLPVLFVCKDDGWAITTITAETSGTSPIPRAKGLGLRTYHADGLEVESVWNAAREAVASIRDGMGPAIRLCPHYPVHDLTVGFPPIVQYR